MPFPNRIPLIFKTLRELGPRQLGLYAWYQIGLRSGYLRWLTNDPRPKLEDRRASPVDRSILAIPDRAKLRQVLGDQYLSLLTEADEIVAGNARLFGGPVVPLELSVPGPLQHWTAYEKGQARGEREDIKFVWEPGRFGWAYPLVRAYYLNRDEGYAQAFWHYTESFVEANPPYQGPHWASAQEVAFRLIAFAFASQVFSGSSQTTEERLALMANAIAAHAARIPPSLAYARAQNNNHLISEAAGLYTAAIFLPTHPQAHRWRELGWRWFNHALQTQIAADGTYIQHSANYHRLMLQVALWVNTLTHRSRQAAQEDFGEYLFPQATLQRLSAATRWLHALVDPQSGRVPTLGPNDGANIMPLASCPFADYRPVLQAAAQAFLGERPFEAGPWDEMALWLRDPETGVGGKGKTQSPIFLPTAPLEETPHVIRNTQHDSWAYFRVARFTNRPGHADQLHLDLWWRGLNVAQDAGTYLYNAAPPWDNALARTDVHNTLTVDDRDQMTRAGRFLWLDWAQGRVVEHQCAKDGSFERLVAWHDGYHRLGIIHQRGVTAHAGGRWVIEDSLLPAKSYKLIGRSQAADLQPPISHSQTVKARLHWLLPDWPWEFRDEDGEAITTLQTISPNGSVHLCVKVGLDGSLPSELNVQLVRAGELLSGEGLISPTWGWVSPTYGKKKPALSFSIEVVQPLPISLVSEWKLP